MSIAADSLYVAINEFISALSRCLVETTFDEDRNLYSQDIATANEWLRRLSAGEAQAVIAAEILAPSTTKHFTDYWRQGVCGELESTALHRLQETVRSELNL